MSDEDYIWSEFTINYFYPTSIEKLFNYWISKKGLESFFVSNASFEKLNNNLAKESTSYEWTWIHGASLSGEYIHVIPYKIITFTFGNMIVSLSFKSIGEKTHLILTQTNIPTDENGKVMGHLNCRSCWVFFLTNLKSVLTTGVDLRDDNPEYASSYEVLFNT